MWENTEYIKEIISNSINKTDVLNKLNLKNNGGNYNTLSSFIIRNNIDISHFHLNFSTKEKKPLNKRNIEEALVLNPPFNIGSNALKIKLYKENLKQKFCELCGQDEYWKGKKMSLILDHINGNRYDNRIENLRIVCPNCNATLETHCRGTKTKKESKHDICLCGGKKKKSSSTCVNCYQIRRKKDEVVIVDIKDTFLEAMNKRRKVQRPPYETLLLDIEELGFVGTGKKYNVSDNSIRKWIKMYQKHG